MRLTAALTLLAVLSLACGRDACPPQLTTIVDPENADVHWGGDTAKVTASLTRVGAECIREQSLPVEVGSVKRGPVTSYTLAATAQITYAIKDLAFLKSASRSGDLQGTVVFEASTGTGVILGSSTGTFAVISGGSSATASAKISGLSPDEVRRVKFVAARWQYGRGY